MKIYQKKFAQIMPLSLADAWAFFATPKNLNEITPTDMHFEQNTPIELFDKMYPGMIITYKVAPFKGLAVDWVTEITHVKHLEYFIDEQRAGPFSFFHHQHHFKAISGGVEMTDLLSYAVPAGVFGRIANSAFVSDKLDAVFAFRSKKIKEIFGAMS